MAAFAACCLTAVSFAGGASAARPQTPAYTLDTVLLKMDGVSRTFTGMESAVERIQYVDLTEQNLKFDSGKLYIARKAKEASMRYDIKSPSEQIVVVDKGKVQLYNPKEKKVDIRVIDPAKAGDLELLLVGFGQSREDILRLYQPSIVGLETADGKADGKKTVVLDLKPKGNRQNFTAIRLWLDTERWIPVRTRITQPSRDAWTIIYRDVKIGNIPESTFELKLPKDVKISP